LSVVVLVAAVGSKGAAAAPSGWLGFTPLDDASSTSIFCPKSADDPLRRRLVLRFGTAAAASWPALRDAVLSVETGAAMVFLRFLAAGSSTLPTGLALLSRKDILETGRSGAGSGAANGMPARIDCRSLLARVASAFRSSALQLSVCRVDGMSSFDSARAATVQGTSGGGGVGPRGTTGTGTLDSPEKLRRAFSGSTALLTEACVGEQYEASIAGRDFFGGEGGLIGLSSSFSSSEIAHHDGSYW
jgi:hypothetical protein